DPPATAAGIAAPTGVLDTAPAAPPPMLGRKRVHSRSSGRLTASLRALATAADPLEDLIAAAVSAYQGDSTMALAQADLAVTGGRAYARFVADPPTDVAVTAGA